MKAESKWDVQLRKGSLELVILAALQPKALYGLELLNYLHEFETMKISEGTLYPLLDRLKREGVIDANWVQEGELRPRKYYTLNQQGQQRLTDMNARWQQSVNDILALLKRTQTN